MSIFFYVNVVNIFTKLHVIGGKNVGGRLYMECECFLFPLIFMPTFPASI